MRPNPKFIFNTFTRTYKLKGTKVRISNAKNGKNRINPIIIVKFNIMCFFVVVAGQNATKTIRNH